MVASIAVIVIECTDSAPVVATPVRAFSDVVLIPSTVNA